MALIWLGLFVLLLCFTFVLMFGAPFLPTMRHQQDTALDLLNLQPGQKLYDLGSGDGRLLVAAYKRGLSATGYELNPLLLIITRLRLRRYNNRVKVIMGDFWKADITDADGVFVFLIGSKMNKLDKFMIKQSANRSIMLASYGFAIPGKKPISTKNGIYLYKYGRVARRPQVV